MAPTRLVSVNVQDPADAAKALGLRAADAGANVVLLQPEDGSLFDRAEDRDGLRTARLPVVVADLLSGPGRSPAEEEALMEWMAAHEEVWRGGPGKAGDATFIGTSPGEEADAKLLAALKVID